jgi:hypothetical protein
VHNTIDARIVFGFRGETHSPTATIDLDQLMESGDESPDLHRLLARLNQIDTYSYLYEVMEATPIEFSTPRGLAIECLSDGHFDLQKFIQLWQQQPEFAALHKIAKEHLAIDDLAQHPNIHAALRAAFDAGKQAND